MSEDINNRYNEYINFLKQYNKLGFKFIPLRGKRPYWEGWSNPEKWFSGEYSNQKSAQEILTKNTNVGVLTGDVSKIVAIDVDQPYILGYNPNYAIKKGALAHTTSKAPRLIIYSDNLEVLAFSKKLTKKWTELTEEEKEKAIGKEEIERTYEELKEKFERGEISEEEFKRKIPVVTIIEILGNGRQFVAPPSIHPEKGIKFEWITRSYAPRFRGIKIILCLNLNFKIW